jgi:hypothetical protein
MTHEVMTTRASEIDLVLGVAYTAHGGPSPNVRAVVSTRGIASKCEIEAR